MFNRGRIIIARGITVHCLTAKSSVITPAGVEKERISTHCRISVAYPVAKER